MFRATHARMRHESASKYSCGVAAALPAAFTVRQVGVDCGHPYRKATIRLWFSITSKKRQYYEIILRGSPVLQLNTFETPFFSFSRTCSPNLDSRDVFNVLRQAFALRVPMADTQPDRMPIPIPWLPCAYMPMFSLLVTSRSKQMYSVRKHKVRLANNTKVLQRVLVNADSGTAVDFGREISCRRIELSN